MNMKKQKEIIQHDQISQSLKENACEICDTIFESIRKSACCSERCRQIHRSNKKLENQDHIVCPVCKQKVKQITIRHAKSHGYSTIDQMKKSLNMASITCESVKELVRGKNNPGYQHGGRFSKLSKNFIHGYDAEWVKERAKEHSKFRKDNKELFKTNIEYWQAQYPDNMEKAEQEYKKFQIRDLDYFVNKYGEEEGKERHKIKTQKWIKNMPNLNFSMISQELFNTIMQSYEGDVYYATYPRTEMKDYKNKEYRLQVQDTYVLPDFIDLHNNKIIEFDGDYWHSESKVNPVREKERENKIKKQGYEIFRVREQDYNKDKEKVIQKCLNFLKK